MPTPDPAVAARRQRIIAGLQGRGLDQAIADPALWNDLEAEARSDDPHKLVTPDLLLVARQARMVRLREPNLGLFFNTDDVILIPGFLGSQLVDAGGGNGLIWIDPTLVFAGGQLLALGLGAYQPGAKDTDAAPNVTIRPQGAVPVLYDGLRLDLEVRRYGVQVFGFDWRKSAQESAEDLAALIRDRAGRRFRPLHLIAHSQGSLVARRALQLVGPDLARRLVNNLVLLSPATAGTFAAAFALAGNPGLLETLRRFFIQVPEGFTPRQGRRGGAPAKSPPAIPEPGARLEGTDQGGREERQDHQPAAVRRVHPCLTGAGVRHGRGDTLFQTDSSQEA
jgi:pimeloyl-ACP methyl ester carboxylesterase